MELTRLEQGGKPVYAVTGKCTVEHAAALRQALLEAVSANTVLSLDVSGVEEADITFLQLLLATALTLEQNGGSLRRHGPVSPAALAAARVSGFARTPKLANFFSDED
ncbi:STAS domain-containing protein [Solidesulfovibrio carbinolicus]|uniref:Anti-anti-sigma factor n=1 Tax=Solidesulfovibrio carbinolicus TaxID=296842 RepID=A0A4P6I0Q2_9BACT|nr:STAS domain-containing protein [Solidesulfovibrio carbinolicus]QAZ67319.1 anti-anti-sigma factor [Solidesulfovibrio carbinolicus]